MEEVDADDIWYVFPRKRSRYIYRERERERVESRDRERENGDIKKGAWGQKKSVDDGMSRCISGARARDAGRTSVVTGRSLIGRLFVCSFLNFASFYFYVIVYIRRGRRLEFSLQFECLWA